MDLGVRQWLIALISALAVHLSLLTLFQRPAEPVGPARGILIELGDGRGAGNGAPSSDVEDLPKAEPEEQESLESEAVTDDRVEEPEPSADPVAPPATVPVPEPEPVVAELAAPAKTEKPKVARSSKRKKKPLKTRRDNRIAEVAAGNGGSGKAGKGPGKQGAGSGSATSVAVAKSRYAALVSGWLNRNKRYPKRARRLGHEGSVTIRFTVDREGNVLSSDIVRSSGHAALDDEVRALMRRGPMPRMPAAMKQARMTMTVPIRFRLR